MFNDIIMDKFQFFLLVVNLHVVVPLGLEFSQEQIFVDCRVSQFSWKLGSLNLCDIERVSIMMLSPHNSTVSHTE